MTAINNDIPSSFFRDNIWISPRSGAVFGKRKTLPGCGMVSRHAAILNSQLA
jgi:hypothetical protein